MSANIDDLDRELASLDAGREDRIGGVAGLGGGLRLLPIAVLVVALVAVGAVVWYAYNQGVKSGSEEAAPLLRPEGPAKVQPDDPGGLRIPHTDKSVYDTVSGDGGAETKVERILPPPEEPRLPSRSETASVSQEPPPPPSITQDTNEPLSLGVTGEGEETPPLPSPELTVPAEPPTAGATETASAEPKDPPKEQPAAKPAPAPEPAPAPSTSAATASLANSWRIQVVAAGSEAAAQKVWSARAAAFPTLLGGKTLQIIKFTKGSKTYYRARGGPFADRNAATAACDALKAKKLGCLIVKPGA